MVGLTNAVSVKELVSQVARLLDGSVDDAQRPAVLRRTAWVARVALPCHRWAGIEFFWELTSCMSNWVPIQKLADIRTACAPKIFRASSFARASMFRLADHQRQLHEISSAAYCLAMWTSC